MLYDRQFIQQQEPVIMGNGLLFSRELYNTAGYFFTYFLYPDSSRYRSIQDLTRTKYNFGPNWKSLLGCPSPTPLPQVKGPGLGGADKVSKKSSEGQGSRIMHFLDQTIFFLDKFPCSNTV